MRRTLGLVATLTLVLVACGTTEAVQPGAAHDGAAASEGIQVHGDWVIEVREPDGSLAERREFANSIFGDGALPVLLSGDATIAVNGWSVRLEQSGGAPGPCEYSWLEPARCEIYESGFPGSDTYRFDTLSVDLTISRTVQLRGTAIAALDGDIGRVSTWIGICDTDQSPDDCGYASAISPFTMQSLAEGIPVFAGQQILVIVTLSFS